MPSEIERRYLLNSSDQGWVMRNASRMVHITQGYLSADPVVRLRLVEGNNASTKKAELTIKGAGTLVRPEFNHNIEVAQALEMWPMVKCEIHKIRRYLELGNEVWEIDEFLGPLAGLWIAELELSDPQQSVDDYAWLEQEVTHDSRYSNLWLAQNRTFPIPLPSP